MALFCYSCNFSILLHKVANFIVIKPQKLNFNNNCQISGKILPGQFLAFQSRISGILKPDIGKTNTGYPVSGSDKQPDIRPCSIFRVSGQITIRYIPICNHRKNKKNVFTCSAIVRNVWSACSKMIRVSWSGPSG